MLVPIRRWERRDVSRTLSLDRITPKTRATATLHDVSTMALYGDYQWSSFAWVHAVIKNKQKISTSQLFSTEKQKKNSNVECVAILKAEIDLQSVTIGTAKTEINSARARQNTGIFQTRAEVSRFVISLFAKKRIISCTGKVTNVRQELPLLTYTHSSARLLQTPW